MPIPSAGPASGCARLPREVGEGLIPGTICAVRAVTRPQKTKHSQRSLLGIGKMEKRSAPFKFSTVLDVLLKPGKKGGGR